MIDCTLGMIPMGYLASCGLVASITKPKPLAEQLYFSYSIFKLFSATEEGEGG